MGDKVGSARETVGDKVGSARESVSSGAGSAADTAGGAVSTVKEHMPGAGDAREGARRAASVAKANPMGRLGTADEVCDAAVFLASDQSTYVSGTVIPLDGGMAARRM